MSDDQLFAEYLKVSFLLWARGQKREGVLSGSHNPLSGFLIALSGGNLFWMI